MNKLSTPLKPVSCDEAERLLSPHQAAFREIMESAWKEWERIPVELRSKLNARARANCLYDFIVHQARAHFQSLRDVEIIEKRGLFLLGFAGRIILRFKKLRANRLCSNVPTNQQLRFSLQLELPGIPLATRLNVGYMLDIAQTGIDSILVTLQSGREVLWDFPVLQGTQPSVVPLTLNRPRQAAAKVRARMAKVREGQAPD
jgi:hypothetical protein